jgi:hypothetical protein
MVRCGIILKRTASKLVAGLLTGTEVGRDVCLAAAFRIGGVEVTCLM